MYRDHLTGEVKRRDLGFAVMLATAIIFWGGVWACVGFTVGYSSESAAVRKACERMVKDGWEVTVDYCVTELRP